MPKKFDISAVEHILGLKAKYTLHLAFGLPAADALNLSILGTWNSKLEKAQALPYEVNTNTEIHQRKLGSSTSRTIPTQQTNGGVLILLWMLSDDLSKVKTRHLKLETRILKKLKHCPMKWTQILKYINVNWAHQHQELYLHIKPRVVFLLCTHLLYFPFVLACYPSF